MKINNDRHEYYKLYHQIRMDDPSYAKNYREEQKERAKEYRESRKNNPDYIKNQRKYFKLWRAKNKEHVRKYNKTRKPYVWSLKQRFSKMVYDAKNKNLKL